MQRDPYDWAKERISYLIDEIVPIKNDNHPVSPGKIWSIKKLLALDYYIAASHPIFKKHFKKLSYVDTHCGSGVISFDDDLLNLEKFPGSPLIAALRNKDKPFSDYFFSDSSSESILALNQRLKQLKDNVGNRHYQPAIRNFTDTVQLISDKQEWGRAFLIFVDPTGFTELVWEDVKKLLLIEKADIFITFMSYSFALNRPHALPDTEHEKTFDSVFGNSDWKKCSDQEELLKLYLQQIGTIKKYVDVIPVFRTGESKLYDLIFASNNSAGAGRIMTYTKKIMTNVTTDLIKDALKVVTHKTTDLDKWM